MAQPPFGLHHLGFRIPPHMITLESLDPLIPRLKQCLHAACCSGLGSSISLTSPPSHCRSSRPSRSTSCRHRLKEHQRQDSISNQSLFRSYPPVWIAKRQRHGVPQSETNDPTSEREPPVSLPCFSRWLKTTTKLQITQKQVRKERDKQTACVKPPSLPCVSLSYAQDRNTHTIEVNGEGKARHPPPISQCAAGATDDRIGCSSSSIC